MKELGENYNLGIILLCAPIIRVATENNFIRIEEFRKKLKKTLCSINNKDSELIIEAIKISKPAGLNNFDLDGDILRKSTKIPVFIILLKLANTMTEYQDVTHATMKKFSKSLYLIIRFKKKDFQKKSL